MGWVGFKGINFRCSNSTLTEKWLWWGKPITFLNSRFTWLKKGMGSHSLWVPPRGLAQECKSLWGNKIMIQHIEVGKTSVTGHHWPAENLVSFCYRLSSLEAEAETEFGVPDSFRDQYLPREKGRSRIGQKSDWDAGLTKPWQPLGSWVLATRVVLTGQERHTRLAFLKLRPALKELTVGGHLLAHLPQLGSQGFFGGDLHGISLCLPHFHCVVCNSAMGEMWCPERKYLGLWIQMFCRVRQWEWWRFLFNNLSSSILKIMSKNIYLLKKDSQTWSKEGTNKQ